METNATKYNSAKTWQIGFFALNNTATNLYMFLFMFVSYYATGVAGLLVVTVTTIMTAMRIFDGFTDPVIGFFIDKTESKYGKFRPFMLLGNIVLALSSIVLFTTTSSVPEGSRLVYFIAIYSVYIIGYTFQTACTKAAQTVLTNDPSQRPMFTLFDGIYNTALFIGAQMYISTYLIPKHAGFNQGLFNEFLATVVVVSAVFTLLSITSIWYKDVKANWGTGEVKRVKFKEYWPIIKGNKPLQMLIVAASTDKLAMQTRGNSITTVIIYGILMANYGLSGKVGLIATVPAIIITYFGIRYAKKMGIRKAYVVATVLSIAISVVLFLTMWLLDLTTISLAALNIGTIIFIALFTLQTGVMAVGGNIVIPMIADCSDYQTYKTGQYIPGMIGTIFSFIDKLISSLATALIGVFVAMIGFKETLPTIGDVATPELFWMGMFFFIGMPILGWVASLIAMKFYELDYDKMAEVQAAIAQRKA